MKRGNGLLVSELVRLCFGAIFSCLPFLVYTREVYWKGTYFIGGFGGFSHPLSLHANHKLVCEKNVFDFFAH